MTPKRIQRQRTKGWRMPEGAVYVGRPSPWGNPWPVDYRGDIQPWLALALGERADERGRRAAAVKAFGWWIRGMVEPFPVKAATDGPGDIDYTDGTSRHIADVPAAMGTMMLARQPISAPPRPDLAPLRGRDLACWCPEQCEHEVALTGAAYGEIYDRCTKPTGHDGAHDPSAPPYCHADVLLELANR